MRGDRSHAFPLFGAAGTLLAVAALMWRGRQRRRCEPPDGDV